MQSNRRALGSVPGTSRHAPLPTRCSRLVRTRSRCAALAVDAQAPAAALEDKFLARNFAQFKDASVPASLASMHASCWSALPSMRMPTTRNEEYRFTDITPLTRATLVASDPAAGVSAEAVASMIPTESAQSHVVIVNGVMRPQLSNLSALPKGTYVGGLDGAPSQVAAQLGAQASSRGGPFAVLNGAAAREVLVVALPPGATVEVPLYILYISTASPKAGTTSVAAPRVLLHAGAGSMCTLLEEFTALGGPAVAAAAAGASGDGAAAAAAPAPAYFNCSVAELSLERDAQVTHGYVCREAQGALHFKATLVEQAEASHYSLTEARLGGALTRHDVVVSQAGPRTDTNMRHFVLSGAGQLHDLHTKLVLDHPEGTADQLHKCIVTSSTARGVFDGNVKVNRAAQRTDAGQLSRNLLLAPRATVNVKPNLQIIADDVKCTHGCAVSDLSEEELFYFQARGISALAARQSLVASFGAEVTQRLKLKSVLQRVQADVAATLSAVDLAATAQH